MHVNIAKICIYILFMSKTRLYQNKVIQPCFIIEKYCYLSMVAINSSLDLVFDILSFRNSIVSIGVISAKWLRKAQILWRVISSTSKSSLRVPEATISIAG